MKNLAPALLALAALVGTAHAGIAPGCISFVGFNADGNDNLSIVAIDALPSGTVINFTDNEWNGTTFIDANENGFSLTLTSDVAAGQLIKLDNLGGSGPFAGTSNVGTVSALAGAGTNLGIGNSDEAIIAFLGSFAAPTAFLAAIGNDVLANTGNSLAGTGLVEGSTAFFLPGDEDIFEYIASRSDQATFPAYLTQINTAANWISQDGSGDQSIDATNPNVPFSNEVFTVPTPGAAALLGLGGLMAARRRRA